MLESRDIGEIMNGEPIKVRIAILLAFMCFTARGEGGEAWVPKERHYIAALQAKDRQIYRSLVRRALSQIEEAKQNLKLHTDALKARRAELEECAKQLGVNPLEVDEEQLAEVCPEAYQRWLSPGYRMQMTLEDIEGANEILLKVRKVVGSF